MDDGKIVFRPPIQLFLQIISLQMLNLIYSMLGMSSIASDSLRSSSTIDVKSKPTELVTHLKQGNFDKFITKINEKSHHPLLALRKLSLVHYILLHYPELGLQFETICFKIVTQDLWLNQNILQPYSVFLYKIIYGNEHYRQAKVNKILEISFKMLFYTINTLKDLFACVKKMCFLSRYYNKIQKELNSSLTSDYVCLIAFEAQEFYNCFKAVLGEMIAKAKKYITTQAEKMMIKSVIENELPKINEEMKNLFLDKHYFPYGKGFAVRLLNQEELSLQNEDFIDFVMGSSRLRCKKPKKLTLDRLLFGADGHLNPEVLQSLSQILQTDDSLSISRNRYQRSCYSGKVGINEVKTEITQNV